MSPNVARHLAILDRFDAAFGVNNCYHKLTTWKNSPWKPPQKQLAVFDDKTGKYIMITPREYLDGKHSL